MGGIPLIWKFHGRFEIPILRRVRARGLQDANGRERRLKHCGYGVERRASSAGPRSSIRNGREGVENGGGRKTILVIFWKIDRVLHATGFLRGGFTWKNNFKKGADIPAVGIQRPRSPGEWGRMKMQVKGAELKAGNRSWQKYWGQKNGERNWDGGKNAEKPFSPVFSIEKGAGENRALFSQPKNKRETREIRPSPGKSDLEVKKICVPRAAENHVGAGSNAQGKWKNDADQGPAFAGLRRDKRRRGRGRARGMRNIEP